LSKDWSMERTLFIIKPDAVRRNYIGDILGAVEKAGLTVIALRMLEITAEQSGEFYQVHRGKEFYDKLVAYMSSGRCVVAALEGDRAISRLREVCGATDPVDAAEGTIRASFGINVTMNSVHASDSPASAAEELRFFFPELA
jgi:nucleoside-diphosphate kinase